MHGVRTRHDVLSRQMQIKTPPFVTSLENYDTSPPRSSLMEDFAFKCRHAISRAQMLELGGVLRVMRIRRMSKVEVNSS